ncbi:efflux RND transporter periplasmic adaptor subunit [Candidatus Riflebacteria bacterium]
MSREIIILSLFSILLIFTSNLQSKNEQTHTTTGVKKQAHEQHEGHSHTEKEHLKEKEIETHRDAPHTEKHEKFRPQQKDDHDGHDHATDGHDDEYPSVVEINEKDKKEIDLKISHANPGAISRTLLQPAHVTFNSNRLAHIVSRVPGIVKKVYKIPGDSVKKGELLAVIESREISDARLDFLVKYSELGCCAVNFTRAREINNNTKKLLAILSKNPDLDQLGKYRFHGTGENQKKLVSAYIELNITRKTYLREKSLTAKKISSKRELLEAENNYKKAQASYLSLRDSILFEINQKFLEARQEQTRMELEARNAERTLYVLDHKKEEIEQLKKLLVKEAKTVQKKDVPPCTEPYCKNCIVSAANKTPANFSDSQFSCYRIYAPFAGKIIASHLTQGEKLADQVIFELADLNTLWVDIQIFPEDLPFIQVGQKVYLQVEKQKTVQTSIQKIIPIINPETRTAVARVVLNNKSGQFYPGAFVNAKIEIQLGGFPVVIPEKAVFLHENKRIVFIPKGAGYQPVEVTIGHSGGGLVEIRKGLGMGDRFVAKGAFNLKAKMVLMSLGDSHAGHGH